MLFQRLSNVMWTLDWRWSNVACQFGIYDERISEFSYPYSALFQNLSPVKAKIFANFQENVEFFSKIGQFYANFTKILAFYHNFLYPYSAVQCSFVICYPYSALAELYEKPTLKGRTSGRSFTLSAPPPRGA